MPVGAPSVAVVLAPTLIVWSAPPFILYVIVTGKVCGLVKVNNGEASPRQTDAVPLILAVGVGRTVIVSDPAITLLHDGAAW